MCGLKGSPVVKESKSKGGDSGARQDSKYSYEPYEH
jgi:hypothetical protein